MKVTEAEEKNYTHFLALLELLKADSTSLLLALALLQEGLRDKDLVLAGDGATKVSIVCPWTTNLAECKNCSYSATFSTEGKVNSTKFF